MDAMAKQFQHCGVRNKSFYFPFSRRHHSFVALIYTHLYDLLSIIITFITEKEQSCKMQYSTLLLATLVSLASAQNPFSINPLPQSISVGTPFNITWAPSTGATDTVSLLLRQGDPSHLATVATIACTCSQIPKVHPD